jgi:hypothetical protein
VFYKRVEPMAETKCGVRVDWEALWTFCEVVLSAAVSRDLGPGFDEGALRAVDRRTSPARASGNGLRAAPTTPYEGERLPDTSPTADCDDIDPYARYRYTLRLVYALN